jgi:shikimate kinase
MKKPIALLGLPGSGKTYWGQQLAERFKIPFFDLDIISQQAGMSIKEIFDEGGEALFRSIESSALFEICQNELQENFVLALGGGTPAFNSNMAIVNQHCTSIYLSVPIAQVALQLTNDNLNHRPLVHQASEIELDTYLKKLLKEREISYHLAHYQIEYKELEISNFEKIIKDVK